MLASSCEGVKRTDETRAKISAAIRNDSARIEKLRAMGKKPKSKEHREKISQAHKGLKPTEETRAKLRAASAKRWKKET